MGISPEKASRRRKPAKLPDRLDELLKRREDAVAAIAEADMNNEARLAMAKKAYDEELGTTPLTLQMIEIELRGFLERHHYPLSRRLSQTITREHGEVKIVRRAKELDMPKSEGPIVKYLLARRGGKRYLIPSYKVNRRAVLQGPASLLRELAPFGVWRGRHRLISVKSLSDEKATTLSQKRFNERTR